MKRIVFTVFVAVVGLCLGSSQVTADLLYTNFAEYNTVVNGYQDQFDGSTLNPNWLVYDGSPADPGMFTLSGTGVLQMHPANGDPNKLLYNPAGGYNATNQNVLVLIRALNDPGDGSDAFRGGVGVAASSANGQGINLHFREANTPGAPAYDHFRLLNDTVAWGPTTTVADTWTAGQWKWLRLVSDGTTVSAKIWDAGTAPEPVGWDLTWGQAGRTGLAGLVTDSIGGAGQFEADYVLIQASGLPSTLAIPEPAAGALLILGSAFVLRRRR